MKHDDIEREPTLNESEKSDFRWAEMSLQHFIESIVRQPKWS